MLEADPLVCIVVLNYNGRRHLEYCLPAILSTHYKNFIIVMVDNNSSDDSVAYVQERYPTIRIINSGSNLGWAGGNNLGVEYARQHNADIVCLANNDIVVHRLWVDSAVKAFRADKNTGFVGCKVYGALRAAPYEDFIEASKHLEEVKHHKTDEYIDGMALFVRMEVFDVIGNIDEKYFVYAEETDLEVRGFRAGFLNAKTNVPVWHYSSGTLEKMRIKASFFAIRNNIRLAIKHDSLLKIGRRILSIYKIGCSPWFRGDRSNVTISRQRPKGVGFNFLLITYCLLWNLANLKQTLKRRSYEYSLINKIRGGN